MYDHSISIIYTKVYKISTFALGMFTYILIRVNKFYDK